MRAVVNAVLLLFIAVALVLAWAWEPDRSVESLTERYRVTGSQFLELDGMSAHVAVEGSGPALVLLHGTGASLHTWNGWVEALTGDFRIVRMDLPGFGLTGPHPAGDYSIGAYMQFVDAVTRRLDIEDFHLAGNSLGGRIAWNYAVAHPERVNRLILIDASGYRLRRTPSLIFRLAALPGVGDALAKLTPRSLYRRSLEEVYADDDRVDEALVDRYFELSLREGNREAFVQRARAASRSAREDPSAALAQIGAPTLVQWGAQDEWIPPEHGRRFADDIPDARFVVYEDLAHVPMEEAPARTARDAREFLRAD
ncbi:alpha/beta fold hydrolase [Lentisalinibacter sediminis]|uniref:alpha/beta fold hydrolase n=1 Tax=Lentisalinibacter sediminis TaxID=2992237 RepID=UPI00386EB82A